MAVSRCLAFALALGVVLPACAKDDSEIAKLHARLDDQELKLERLRKRVAAMEDDRDKARDAPLASAAPLRPHLDVPPPPPTAVAASGPLALIASPSSSSARSQNAAIIADVAKGITRVSSRSFRVERRVVDKIIENQADLMRQARIVPEQENGKVTGIRLFGVRSDTLLGTLGFENGDRLESINGFDLTSPEKALEAYAKMRTAKHLSVRIHRHGEPATLEYTVE